MARNAVNFTLKGIERLEWKLLVDAMFDHYSEIVSLRKLLLKGKLIFMAALYL